MTIANNTKLGRYEIISPIGAGGMGEVYLAEDARLHRKVALKVLPENIAADKHRLRRFEQEAFAASALNHPNILTIYEFGAENEIHFLAAEFVEGETLRERLQREPFSIDEALDVAAQTVSALAAAHTSGIIHRDIKPENIMIRRDRLVKVLDFGLAKLLEKKTETSDAEAETRAQVNTAPGMIMGTAGYMSPEQARGNDTDARSDIWNFGVVLYEMLTRRQPFAGETVNDMIAAVLTKQPAPPRNFNQGIPAELERIVLKTLAKNVEERYQTAKDLLVDLKHLKKQIELGEEIERTASANNRLAEQSENATQIIAAQTTSGAQYGVGKIKNHKPGFVILSVLVLAVIGFGYWFFLSRSASKINIESIAVLPFVNASGNADVEYLSDGMTETLINSLSQLPKLNVKARSSVFRYKGKEVEPRTVAAELSVQAILTGRVVQRGDDLALYLSLVDARNGNHLWGEGYNRKLADLVSLQKEIARDVSQKLRVRLSGADEQRLARNYTENVEAYQLYLKGRFFWDKGTFEGSQKSIEFYNAAIENDPAYALAYAGLADSYLILGRYHGVPPREAMPRAEAAARRALEIDNALAEAYASLGAVSATYNWNWAEAERNYQRAISLNPNYAPAHYRYAEMLANIGRFDQAVTEARRAQELDPLSLTSNINVAGVLYKARRYDEALEQLREILEMNSNFAPTHLYFGINYLQKGMHEEAISAFKRALTLSNNSPDMMGLLGYAYASAGKMDEAQAILDQLEKITPPRYVAPYTRAQIYIALGDKDRAFVWLEKAYEERTWLMGILKVDPLFDPLRSDTRFADLLRRMNFYQ